MESLSSYARQFLGQMEKPDVESIEGLPPAISIDQKSTNRNPRSTVGTVTEIYDYFRLLYARVGIPHCPKCGKVIAQADRRPDGGSDYGIAGAHEDPASCTGCARTQGRAMPKLLDQARRSGYVRVDIDGNVYELSEEIKLDKNIKHNIAIVVDRLIVKPGIEKRLTDSLETVLKLADGLAGCGCNGGEIISISARAFPARTVESVLMRSSRRSFSFNNPFGSAARSVLALVIRWSLMRI